MKNYKKIVIIKIFTFLSILSCNLNLISQHESDISRFNNLDEYAYTKTIETKTAVHGKNNDTTQVVSDVIVSDTFSTGETRIKVTESTANDIATITTEIWKTKNPSYLTWQNGTLVLTSAAALGIGAWAATQGFNFYTTEHPNSLDNNMIASQPEKKTIIEDTNQNIENWEAGVYDGDHVIFNTKGLSADAPWSEKLAITAGGTALGYTPFAIGSTYAYLRSIGALGTEGVTTGLQNFGRNSTTLPVSQAPKSNLIKPQSPSHAELARQRMKDQVYTNPIHSTPKLPVTQTSTTNQSPSNAELARQRMKDLFE